MSEALNKNLVLDALRNVKGPDASADIVAQGLVSEIVIHKGKVYFAIRVDPARAGELEAGPRPGGGFRVRARFPIEQPTAPDPESTP